MEFWLRLGAFIQNLLLTLMRPIFAVIYRKKPPVVPESNDPLLKLPAVTVARMIREGEISSQEVVEAYIRRIKEVNSYVNAVVEARFDNAISEAKNYDRNLKTVLDKQQLAKDKPLYGVPITVKESCSLKGSSLVVGTLVRRGCRATEDSFVVECMRNAGAIPLCVTSTPELCTGFNSSNYVTGTTRNPYDGRCTAGGSSSGEGALLGSGASLIGIGSDLAGSIRVPALFNGIFGHKPTAGVATAKGHYPFSEDPTFKKYLVIGPLVRYAPDLKLCLKVISVNCDRPLRLDEPVDVPSLNVYYKDDVGKSFGLIPASRDIRNSITEAVSYLKKRGCSTKELPIDSTSEYSDLSVGLFFSMKDMPQILMDPNDPKHEKSALIEFAKAIFGLSQYTKAAIFVKLMKDLNGLIPPSHVSKYEEQGEKVIEHFTNLLGDNGVLIYPTYPYTAPYEKFIPMQIIAGIYCLLWNVLGFPSTQVPMGLNKHGMPVGFQVVAAPFQDRLCIAVAEELERGFGGWVPPRSG